MLAATREVLAYRELVKNLVSRDLKIKYKSSVLGFLWSLLNPLLMLVVYTFAFRYVLGIGDKDFAFYFIVAFLPWSFFSTSLALAVGCVVDNANLLRKVYFPREILPLTVVLSSFVQFLLTSVVLIPSFLYFHRFPGASLVLLLPLLVLHIAFTLGLAMVLATIYVYFRDTRHFVEILLTVWFWLTPVIYPLAQVEKIDYPILREALFLNPMTQFVAVYRSILYEGAMPEVGVVLQVAVWSVLSLTFGAWLFSRYKVRFAEAV